MSSQGPTGKSNTSPYPSSAPIAIGIVPAIVPAYKAAASKPSASSAPTVIQSKNPLVDDISDEAEFMLGSSPKQPGRKRILGI